MAASQFKKIVLEPSPFCHLLADFIQINVCFAEEQAQQFWRLSWKSVENGGRKMSKTYPHPIQNGQYA
jgi:hypothetical protein